MSVNPDIHDKAYQFFIEEATELLQIIEDGILELRRDRGANTVHAVMRAAHSIKGGAASVELEAIKSISHRMETAFRALYDETVEIDDELEGLLLDGFDCLKDPLSEQIETGSHDPEAALANAIPVLEALEDNLGAEALKQADNYIPSSSDLGIDMVTSIFEIDVEEGIAHLENLAANPENFPVLAELQVQAEVFIGFGELLELPGFGAIAQAIFDACHNNPADPMALLNLALADLHAAKELVMGGDRDQGGAPSEALLALAGGGSGSAQASSAPEAGLSAGDFADFGLSEADLANFDFANADFANADLPGLSLEPDESSLGESGLEESSSTTSEAASLEDGLEEDLTDAGLGDLDLAALTLEGDALLETAGTDDAQPKVDIATETTDVDFGADDFQALIDDSSRLDLSEAAEDEFATVEQIVDQNDLTSHPASLEDPAVAELGDHPGDTVAFNSLDAMAQLVNLMADPDTQESPASEAEASPAIDADLQESADFDFALNNDLEASDSQAFDADLGSDPSPSLEFNDGEAASPPALSQGEEIFVAFPEEFEDDDGLATEIQVEHPVTIAAPDAELENMWAELSDDLGEGLGEGSENAMAIAEDSELDSAFEIAMDQASEVEESQIENSLEEEGFAEIFADDAIALEAAEELAIFPEQDTTTALSVAEADAAFAAMVDASTAETSDAILDPETSLNLSFDDEPPVAETEAQSNSDFQGIFALDLPATEASDREQISQDDANATDVDVADVSTTNVSATDASDQELADPWSSLVIEEVQTSTAAEEGSEAATAPSDSLDSRQAGDDFAIGDEPAMELSQRLEASDTDGAISEPISEPISDPVSGPTAEFINEGTFVQTNEVMSSNKFFSTPNDDVLRDSDKSSQLDRDDLTGGAPLTESAQLEESSPSEFDGLASEPIEAGTFIQNLDDGTFIQAMEAMPNASLDSSAPETNDSSPSQTTDLSQTAESSHNAESNPLSEPFDEGTFIQAFEEGTFIQEMVAQPSEDSAQAQPPLPEEIIDEGTYLQGIAEGTFIQGIVDAANAPIEQGEQASPESEDEWAAPAAEEPSGPEESLIPELQAFIAQAAAESANSTTQAGESQVEKPATAEPAIAEPATAEFEPAETEVTEPQETDASQDTEPQATEASQDTEPQVAASVTTDQASGEANRPEANGPESIASLPNLSAPSNDPDLNLSTAALEPGTTAEDNHTGTPETPKLTPPEPEEAGLPSLETMFAVGPEQLAAIANDSLASELMTDSDLEAMQLIQNRNQSGEESSPEAMAEPITSEDPESVPVATFAAIAQPDKPPHTSTAVEVALAEQQAVEPGVTPTPISQAKSENINSAVHAVEQMFGQLPTNNQLPPTPVQPAPTSKTSQAENKETAKAAKKKRQQGSKLSGISVRVDLSVLERMNNLVGELVLSRNSLSLQHEQLQSVVTQLDKRFNNFEGQLNGLRGISDQMLVEPAQRKAAGQAAAPVIPATSADSNPEDESLLEGFDVLEMDRYSALHGQLQEIFEQLMQLEEGVDDIGVLLEQSTQSLTQQRQRLGLLQNELMWARMLPLDNILGRFPRVLRDMARKHGKSVDLNMNGTSVLVDKGMLEKLHDPMLHLLRNAFDHGIEKPEERTTQGKSDRGEIQINAYYQGNQTVIEIKDDGQGVNLERIAKRAVELEWLSREEIKSLPQQALLDLIFEPGFSTAVKLSELSGRGVGLDVVREQIKSLKGSVTVDFEKGKGTTFTLRLPLTLTVAKLMVCQVGTTAIALPSDGIEDLLVPQPEQLKMVGNKRLLHWRDDLIPIQPMAELLDYSCPTADIASLKAITAKSIPVPKDWALPLLIFSRGSQRCAMEVNRLLMEQELVIKPFSSAMAPPKYSYGCTILGDGRMIPVLDGTALLQQLSNNSMAMAAGVELNDELLLDEESSDGTEATATIAQAMQTDTLLIVDDSTAMRRTMALSLEKAGYRVLQAGDGQEALTQLRQSSAIQLVICDVEMPNMNGFEFLSQRRREPMLMKIPVVMLTSRSSDKHRRLAMQLKAHDYFSKPYVEQDFLQSIKTILTTQGAVAKV